MSVTYPKFNTAFAAFRLANWLRRFVDTLCSPKGSSVVFTAMTDTVVNDRFIEFCLDEFPRQNNLQPDDDAPDFVVAAEAKVKACLEDCRNKKVAALQRPMKDLEDEIIPLLLDLVKDNERLLQQRFGKTLDVLELEIRRIARQFADKALNTAWEIRRILQEAGALPTRDSGSNSLVSEPDQVGGEIGARPVTGTPRTYGMKRGEANRMARKLLTNDPEFANKTQREWAEAIGCSEGLVNSLPVREAIMEERRKNDTAKTYRPPKVVGFTDEMQAVTGREDDPSNAADTDAVMRKLMEAALPEKRAELNNLTPEERRELAKAYMEQDADAEPSPLEDDLPLEPPKKVKTRMRL